MSLQARIPLALALLVALAGLPTADSATLERPDLRVREYWSYGLVGPGDDGGSAQIQVRDASGERNLTVEVRTRSNETLPNGSFEVRTRTRLQVSAGDLGVAARESVTVRDGTFRERPVWSYSRNITRYREPIPLVPGPSDPGDVWATDTRARSVVNQTSRVGSGEDAETVESGPRRYNTSFNATLRVVETDDVTVPAGTFNATVVNRTRSDQAGYTLEWWAREPGYLARWETRGPDGDLRRGAVLEGWGRHPPPAGDGIPWAKVAAGVGAVAVLGLGGVAAWRRVRG